MSLKKTEKQVRKIIKRKIQYTVEKKLDEKLDPVIEQMKYTGFDKHDDFTITFTFEFKGFDFLRDE